MRFIQACFMVILMILFVIIVILFSMPEPRNYHPPRDQFPRSYETVTVLRFEDTICYRCHR